MNTSTSRMSWVLMSRPLVESSGCHPALLRGNRGTARFTFPRSQNKSKGFETRNPGSRTLNPNLPRPDLLSPRALASVCKRWTFQGNTKPGGFSHTVHFTVVFLDLQVLPATGTSRRNSNSCTECTSCLVSEPHSSPCTCSHGLAALGAG